MFKLIVIFGVVSSLISCKADLNGNTHTSLIPDIELNILIY